jgi:membrane protein implicated in regulation of membrane protease activity
MNYYPFGNGNFRSDDVRELSRGDFFLLAVAFGFFAAVLASSIGGANSTADLLIRSAFTLATGAAAAISLRVALLWGRATRERGADSRQSVTVDPVYELNIFNHDRSKAA